LSVEWCPCDLTASLAIDSHEASARHPSIEGVKCLAHFGMKIGDKVIGFERQIQRLIIRCALRLEVSRQVLIRIAIAVSCSGSIS
jgi:hypothetical protein